MNRWTTTSPASISTQSDWPRPSAPSPVSPTAFKRSRRKAGGRVEKILKYVGATTAVLSLGAAVYGLGHFVHGIVQDRRDVAELMVVARDQQDREQYRDAWATLAEASEIEETSPFVIGAEKLQQAQEDLGIAWLQNIRIGEGETFTAIMATIAVKVSPSPIRMFSSKPRKIWVSPGCRTSGSGRVRPSPRSWP